MAIKSIYSLNDRIREAQQQCGSADPYVIAAHTLDLIKPHELRGALAQTLPVAVKAVVRRQRTYAVTSIRDRMGANNTLREKVKVSDTIPGTFIDPVAILLK